MIMHQFQGFTCSRGVPLWGCRAAAL